MVTIPNWCNNTLIVEGNEKDLEVFETKYYTETKGDEDEHYLDFEKILPRTSFVETKKIEWDKLDEEIKTKRWNNNFSHWEFNNGGYEWNTTNWGVKCNCEINKPIKEKGKLYYFFSSAWREPNGIFEALVKQNPNLYFELDFSESGMGFGGKIIGEKGEVISDEDWNLDYGYCPKCNNQCEKPEHETKYECGECGDVFTQEESKTYEQVEEEENKEYEEQQKQIAEAEKIKKEIK